MITPEEIKASRLFLKSKEMLDIFNAKLFAKSAKELALSLPETLRYLARLKQGGQGLGPSPATEDVLRAKAGK